MTKTACPVALLMWGACALGQTIEPQPRIVTRTGFSGRVSVVEAAAHFVTAIRMPETVNSVVVGDRWWWATRRSSCAFGRAA